jgi:zinc finger protein
MSSAEQKEDLFPTIGEVADQADLVAVDEKDQNAVEDEKVVTEIESLCMKCHEQVSHLYSVFRIYRCLMKC